MCSCRKVKAGHPGGGGGGHSPWFWVPTAKQSPGAVSVNTVWARKRGAVTDQSTLRRGLLEGACSVGAVVVGFSSPRKASWIRYN